MDGGRRRIDKGGEDFDLWISEVAKGFAGFRIYPAENLIFFGKKWPTLRKRTFFGEKAFFSRRKK